MNTARKLKRKLALFVAIIMVVGLWTAAPLQASATTEGDFTITVDGGGDPVNGTDYTYASNTLTIKSGKAMTIAMKTSNATTTTGKIVISTGAVTTAANITLDGVKINISGTDGACALNINASTLNLTLKGENELQSGRDAAGLQLISSGNLVVTEESQGSLVAIGGKLKTYESGGAGIGGGSNTTSGNITINGGNIEAIAGSNANAAGIGGGNNNGGKVGNILITGGTVKATAGGAMGAGIGAGQNNGTCSGITITGGIITAYGSKGNGGAGIGGSNKASSGAITITGGIIEAIGGTSGSGIGGGRDGGACGQINISGGTITATGGGNGGAGIGGGGGEGYTNSTCGAITISGGTVIAERNNTNSQDIGKGQANATSVTITGGTVWAMNNAVNPAPKGMKSANVYANKLSFNPALENNTTITAGSIDGVSCTNTADASSGIYGIKDVKTNTGGQVCFWLPNTAEKLITLTDTSDTRYEASYTRPAAAVSETLKHLPVDIRAIPVIGPYTGKAPVSQIEAEQYTGMVTWNPDQSSEWTTEQTPTATITLTRKAGYFFYDISANWFTVAGASQVTNTSVDNPEGPVTVTAVFPATFYQVKFISNLPAGNSAAGMPDEQPIAPNAKLPRPAETPTTTLYTFDDWYTAANGDEKFDFSAEIDENTEIFAHWTQRKDRARIGDLVITTDDGDDLAATDYSYSGSALTIKSNKAMTISMENGVTTTFTSTIVINNTAGDKKANITLDDVKIDVSGTSNACALNVTSGTLNLTLKGDNELRSSASRAGLQLTSTSSNLVITKASNGASLTARSGLNAAGIGAGQSATGNITIQGGTITAQSAGTGGAGIGAGNNIACGNISIEGGTIVAKAPSASGTGGAGIGAGVFSGAKCGTITITGGTINATGAGNGGAGIGSGFQTTCTNITITGGIITATGGAGYGGAGIGGGYKSDAASNTITITGGTINAKGNTIGAGIGGGNGASRGAITISGGTIIAARSSDTNTQDIGNGSSSAVASVTVTGGSVWAVNGKTTSTAGTVPKGLGGADVYANKLAFDPALAGDTAITAGSINGVDCVTTVPTGQETTDGKYGIKDVKTITDPSTGTDSAVRVCLWLPSTSSEQLVHLQTAGAAYGKNYARTGTGIQAQTLQALYLLSVSPSKTHTFTSQEYGYSALTPAVFTVKNIGSGALTGVDAVLEGNDASDFTLTKSNLTSDLASTIEKEITVVPNTNLSIGTHEATLKVFGTGSSSDNPSVEVALSFEVTAAPVIYPVTFMPNAAEDPSVANMPQTQNVTSGEKANAPASNPTRTGYTFDNWYTQATNGEVFNFTDTSITGNTDVYARWTVKGGYTVSYDTNGGLPGSIGDKGNVTWTTAGLLPEPEPTKAGHTFAGWNVTSGGSGDDVQPAATYGALAANDATNTITLTAQWTANPVTPPPVADTYVLTVTGGADNTNAGPYEEGTSVSITANSAPEGQIFDTWTSSNGGTFADATKESTTFTMPANAVTVTANYKDDPNGGEDTDPPVTDGWVYEDGAWKYFIDGEAVTGWLYDTDYKAWFYLDPDGIMQTGWLYDHDDKAWYYLAGNGKMLTGWLQDDGNWYYLAGNGAMKVGWAKVDGSWYYLSGNGKMLTGTQNIGGKIYTFKSNGVWVS